MQMGNTTSLDLSENSYQETLYTIPLSRSPLSPDFRLRLSAFCAQHRVISCSGKPYIIEIVCSWNHLSASGSTTVSFVWPETALTRSIIWITQSRRRHCKMVHSITLSSLLTMSELLCLQLASVYGLSILSTLIIKPSFHCWLFHWQWLIRKADCAQLTITVAPTASWYGKLLFFPFKYD